MSDRIRWRLTYPDGSEQTEADQGNYGRSIIDSKPNAATLDLILWPEQQILYRLPLEGQNPIFYRWRHLDVLQSGDDTDCLIFGRAIWAGELKYAELMQWYGTKPGPVQEGRVGETAVMWQASRGEM